ncbi:hypothetical protein TNIN_320291 [Trichonephila inaurata madagascariensis]|uniref:Uncharacterized protein n=1 Tax=Trichonephila inaurata madagascariensis TaxID=2747483 RepID=A0A8X6WXG1_9ARAC|nr:hypothetical protein TNIN_320291 [Trichonephila inaurata madagascariensis]
MALLKDREKRLPVSNLVVVMEANALIAPKLDSKDCLANGESTKKRNSKAIVKFASNRKSNGNLRMKIKRASLIASNRKSNGNLRMKIKREV